MDELDLSMGTFGGSSARRSSSSHILQPPPSSVRLAPEAAPPASRSIGLDQLTVLANKDFAAYIGDRLTQAKSRYVNQVGQPRIRGYIASTNQLLQQGSPLPETVPIIEEEEEEEGDAIPRVDPQASPHQQWDAVPVDPPTRGEKARPPSPNDSDEGGQQAPDGNAMGTDGEDLPDLFDGFMDLDSDEIGKGSPPKQPLREWHDGDEEEDEGLPGEPDAFD
jgi:hypothetical protein